MTMEYFRRLKNFWFPTAASFIWLLLALPALYFFQTAVHEGSHAVAAFLVTGNFPKVAPFPHSGAEGGFRNGVTIGDGSSTVSVVDRSACDSPAKTRFFRLAGFPAVPQFVDLGLIAIFTLIFLTTPAPPPFLGFLGRTWYLGAIIDFMYNTVRGLVGGCNPATDWSKFLLQSELSPAVFALLTWVFWLAILSHFGWVYRSKWAQEPPADAGFWNYRWLAFIFGCLSLAAVLLSIFVNDPEIDKSSPLFILPLVVQGVALIGYWLYFGLTFRAR
jgi:hypothetical protein